MIAPATLEALRDVAIALCKALDPEGRACIQPAKHEDQHAALVRWENRR